LHESCRNLEIALSQASPNLSPLHLSHSHRRAIRTQTIERSASTLRDPRAQALKLRLLWWIGERN